MTMGLRDKLSNAKESVKGTLSKAGGNGVDQLEVRKKRAREQARKEKKREMRQDAIKEAREEGRTKARREEQSVFEKLSGAASSVAEKTEGVDGDDDGGGIGDAVDFGSGMPATGQAFGGDIQQGLDGMDFEVESGDPFDYDPTEFDSSRTETEEFDPFGNEEQTLEDMGFSTDGDKEGLF